MTIELFIFKIQMIPVDVALKISRAATNTSKVANRFAEWWLDKVKEDWDV